MDSNTQGIEQDRQDTSTEVITHASVIREIMERPLADRPRYEDVAKLDALLTASESEVARLRCESAAKYTGREVIGILLGSLATILSLISIVALVLL